MPEASTHDIVGRIRTIRMAAGRRTPLLYRGGAVGRLAAERLPLELADLESDGG